MERNNKRKIFLIVTLVLMVCLLTLSLTACSIFDKAKDFFKGNSNDKTQTGESDTSKTVTEVKIDVISGLTKNPDGTYTAKLNTPFTLKMVLNSNAPEKPNYAWYVKTGDSKNMISGENNATLSYTITEITDKTFEIYASANSVHSDAISLTVEYGTLDNVKIISGTDNIIGDTINSDLVDLHPIMLSATWNKTALPEGTECTVKWYVDGDATPVWTGEEYAYVPAAVVGTHTITVEVTDNSEPPIVKTATITVNIIETFLPVDKIELSLDGGADEIGSGQTTQYVQKGLSAVEVTLSAKAYPIEGIDTGLPVIWKWSHYDNTQSKHVVEYLPSKTTTASFYPAYGENYVTAIIGGVESKHITIIYLDESTYNANKQAIEEVFIWENGTYNHYITCQEDLNTAVAYLESKRVTTDDYAHNLDKTFYYHTPSYFENLTEGEPSPLIIALNYIDEAGNFAWRSSGDYMYFYPDSAFANPSGNYSPAEDVEQSTNVILHYSKIPSDDRRATLPIDANPEYPEKIINSDMLWRVVSWGYKPTFNTDETGTKLSAIYDEAREVLQTYINDTDTEIEKVRKIYEWIAQKVDYDYAMLNSGLPTIQSIQYNSYTLEGVFTDADGEGHGQGVCDARAKAFALLCGMENIKAIRVSGYGKGEPHAWNKVFLDTNGDGVREWFVCDPTWGDRSISGGGGTNQEKLTMQYFLVSDAYVSSTHVADEYCYNPTANTTYDYYSSTTVENGDDSFNLYFDSNTELEEALKYAADNHLCIDFRIDTSIWKSQGIFKTAIALSGVGASYSIVVLDETNGNYMLDFA